MSLRALAKIRREPEHYTGSTLAMLGLVLSFVFLFGGVGYGGYVYATEVPEGYTRISFNGMKPDAIQERGGVVVPPDIAALDGKKVFIKGYIRPDSITAVARDRSIPAGARQQSVLLRRSVDGEVLRSDRRGYGGLAAGRLFAKAYFAWAAFSRSSRKMPVWLGSIPCSRCRPITPSKTLSVEQQRGIFMLTCRRSRSLIQLATLFAATAPMCLTGCDSKQAGATSGATVVGKESKAADGDRILRRPYSGRSCSPARKR